MPRRSQDNRELLRTMKCNSSSLSSSDLFVSTRPKKNPSNPFLKSCPPKQTKLLLSIRYSNQTHSSLLQSLAISATIRGLEENMRSVVRKVAVVGSGISGAVCASALARNGVAVTVFDSGRGPGGRMSQRREISEDGTELFFDHGAPFFTVNDNDVMGLVHEWEARGLVAEWKERFGSFDCISAKFDFEKEGSSKKYVGVPGMNSICRAMCHEPGVDTKFGVTVGRLEWLENKNSWLLTGLDGQILGYFDGVVTSDKNTVSPRFTHVTGRPPPLDMILVPELAQKLKEVPVHPCFALMLAFSEPLSSVPVKGFSFKNSDVLSWAHCDSSKPGRPEMSECWVLHSTFEYAKGVISQTGLQKPSNATLTKVAEELFQEFRSSGLHIPDPFFVKAHRGSAFPAAVIAAEQKCLWDEGKRLAICGDFCAGPNVEGAVLSGMRASVKLLEMFSCM
ncbi:renalase isoform X2 [Macadamia integrifolia]|uniref:renalase isoform X2 n=1 Tax=Macadamia integrifolia TaxID=60698 RepID=UPI001C4E37D5|nr:renalase isoform X2 [Macadamia integrifolia]